MTADKPSPFVPKLRFPEFGNMPEWELTQLSDVLDYEQPGKYIVENTSYQNAGTPVLTANKSFVLGHTAETDGIYQNVPVIIFDDFTTDAKYVDFPFKVKSSAIKILTPRGEDELRLVYELMSRIRFDPTQHKRYFISQYQYLRIPLPGKSEQQKIANCLGNLDELIAAEGRKLEALRQHKQGLMQQLFPQPGETVPLLRFPEFRDSPDWKTGRCRDIARVLPGYGFPDKFQGNNKGQFPFYKVSDISRAIEEGNKYISEARNYIESDVFEAIRGRPVPTGTIIFAKIGEAIRSNRRVVTTAPSVIDNNTAGVKAIKMKSSEEFLFYVWSNVSLIDHAGGVVPAVSKSALEDVPLCYPSDPGEQQCIANCLGSLDDLIAAEGGRVEALRQHKQGLMQQLFPSLEAESR